MSRGGCRRFTEREKLEVVLRSYRVRNVRGFCQRQGLDPATLYRWRRELAQAGLAAWSSRRPGRPTNRSRVTMQALEAELGQLLERYRALERQARGWQLLTGLARQVLSEREPGLGLLLAGGLTQ